MRGPELGSGKTGLGKRFGRLIIVGLKPKYRICLCDCGTVKVVRCSSLTQGLTQSCGCLHREKSARRIVLYKPSGITHGLSKHPLYSVWRDMKRRCLSPSHHAYGYYGGRGIMVAVEWQDSFVSFFDWACTSGWKKGLEIDRINNNGNYEPNNCRFVSHQVNCANRRPRSRKASV